jgi:hypothetical protein
MQPAERPLGVALLSGFLVGLGLAAAGVGILSGASDQALLLATIGLACVIAATTLWYAVPWARAPAILALLLAPASVLGTLGVEPVLPLLVPMPAVLYLLLPSVRAYFQGPRPSAG